MDLLQNDKPFEQLPGRMTIDYWSYVLLILYILTMPLVSAFAFTGTISLPLIFAVFLFMIMGFSTLKYGRFPKGFFGVDILIIFLLLFFDVFSYTLNGLGNSKSLNHTVAYIASFILFYVTIKFTFFNIKDKSRLFKRVLQFITYTTLISVLYSNIEFISSNIFGVNLNDYVPRPSEAEEFYNPTALGFIYRARGFATESGHLGFMLELFSPLTIYYLYFSGFCKWNKFLKALSVIAIILSFISTVSVASFVLVPVALFLASLVYAKRILLYLNAHLAKFALITASVLVIVVLLNHFFSFYALLSLSITGKLGSGSYDDRQDRIDFFYDTFFRSDLTKNLSGFGPAGYNILGYDEGHSILSLYYSITFELGFIGLFLVLMLFLYAFVNVFGLKKKLGFFLLISIISGVLHFNFIANFWYPWFWFITAFTTFCNKNKFAITES